MTTNYLSHVKGDHIPRVMLQIKFGSYAGGGLAQPLRVKSM